MDVPELRLLLLLEVMLVEAMVVEVTEFMAVEKT